MSLVRKGRFWHFDFQYRGKRFQGSTDQTNRNKAKLVEAKIRSDVALERFGIGSPKLAPMFQEFMLGRFLAHVRQESKSKPRTIRADELKTARLLEYEPFAKARLNEIDEDLVQQFKADRAKQKRRSRGEGTIQPAEINRELATLRKALHLAYEWHVIARMPRIRSVAGERNRDFVLSGEMETAYLAAACYPLKQAAILMLDLGLRPEECVSLKKADVQNEMLAPTAHARPINPPMHETIVTTSTYSVCVRSGKTKNAVRTLPMPERSKEVIRLLSALSDSEFLFPGRKPGTHLTESALVNAHAKLRKAHGWPQEFVVYSCRHTFGTRLAESGGNPYEVKSLMGHSDIRVSQKYVHPSSDAVERAMRRKEALDKTLRGEQGAHGVTTKESLRGS